MKLKNMLLANSAVSVVCSLALLLMPASILGLFGMTDRATEKLLLQFFGAQLLGTGLLTLFALNTKELRSQRSLTLSLFIADGIAFIVTLGGLLSSTMNALGWIIALLFLLLTLGFGYFQFIA